MRVLDGLLVGCQAVAALPVNAQVSETLYAKQGTKTDEHLEMVNATGDDTMTGELMLFAVAQAVNLSF